MQIEHLGIDGPLLLATKKYADDRGFFSEVYRADTFSKLGISPRFVQDNHARSQEPGTLRGLHYQAPPRGQGKLVRCTRGAILDVALDIRQGSPSFGRHIATELSAANWRQLWIPVGFAHGYVTLESDTEVVYKTTDYYDPTSERGIAWDDPSLDIDWPLPPCGAILSAKDQRNPLLREAEVVFYLDAQTTVA